MQHQVHDSNASMLDTGCPDPTKKQQSKQMETTKKTSWVHHSRNTKTWQEKTMRTIRCKKQKSLHPKPYAAKNKTQCKTPPPLTRPRKATMAFKKEKERPCAKQVQNPMQDIQFHDPDEQRWVELGKLALEKENIYYP